VVAASIAQQDAVAITHQHGCAQVGDDVTYTKRVFASLGVHPNVGGVLVVSLGCETVQGGALAETIEHDGGAVRFVGIQSAGGTLEAVSRGQVMLAELLSNAALVERRDGEASDVVVGLDSADAPFAGALVELARAVGFHVVLPRGDVETGPTCHADLAAAGAQVIVSLLGPNETAMGFPICPVVSVTGDRDLYEAMPQEFDLLASGLGDTDVATSIWRVVVEAFNGLETATERRGASDLLLRRLSRSM